MILKNIPNPNVRIYELYYNKYNVKVPIPQELTFKEFYEHSRRGPVTNVIDSCSESEQTNILKMTANVMGVSLKRMHEIFIWRDY